MKHVLFASLCVFVAACGNGSSSSNGNVPATCPTSFTACGGSVIGTWTIAKVCGLSSLMAGQTSAATTNCPTATVDVSGLSIAGSVTYNSDLSYSQSIAVTGPMVLGYPTSCLNGLTCSTFSALISAATGADSGITSATCTTTSTGCSCSLTLDMSLPESGTYAASGNNLTTTVSSDGGSSTPTTDQYCVNGNTLSMNNGSQADAGSSPAIIYATK